MEGIIFYWVAWSMWIVYTFLMKKTLVRTFLSFFFLILIISEQFTYHIPFGTAGCAYFLLSAAAYGWTVRHNLHRSLRFMLAAVGLTGGFAGLKLMQLFDPVWFTLSPFFLLFSIMFISAGFIGKNGSDKLALFLLASCNGDLLYEGIIFPISGSIQLGEAWFLDFVLLGMAGFSIWMLIEYTLKIGNPIFQKQIRPRQSRNAS
ncbi:hypothetical protein CEF21_14155 [Bacillus sp. FJAT-42376]|uniref:YphA family membrane protein n=1 Tax=Bacillus sp. FJAT-42376 TaxID=2014076 RepID=UPI000F50CF4F|nr:hypothetical protein [Bacillus sp. FJAT-42376]AZB43353.1 hypothetical protein CEF21_14155 [Bacillus sp. FJAT-42376]